ncbi:hypothetical protein DFH08DRAFT_998340 [Mycena albidolilacea]|uniref:Uncharacterized protein n=1 Tax=Mycena albidolilacea TaxID=1033008 RepID=A0AAD7A4R0_9AGAR|nr:hypothetical protein DFH08DRAFT_998340 [Mycena albidolilacea]
MFIKYWAAFPWHLPLTKDPDPSDPTDYTEKPSNEDKEKRKEKIVKETEAPQEVRTRMKKEAEAEHADLLEKYEDALEGLPALDEEDLEDVRSQFSALVGLLLQGLAAHTGYEILLLVGRVKTEGERPDVYSMSMHAGVTPEMPAMLDFSRADAASYVEVMKRFSKFVWGAHNYRTRGGSMEATETPTKHMTPAQTPNPEPAGAPMAPVPQTLAVTSAVGMPMLPPTVPAVGVGITDTFSNTEIRTMVGPPVDLSMLPGLDNLNFPEELLQAAGAAAGIVSPGLRMAMGPVMDSYNIGFAAPLSSDLLLRLEGMSVEERAAKIDELKGLNADDLERENNTARNYYSYRLFADFVCPQLYLLEGLGLASAEKETLWGGTVTPTKRKAGTQVKRKSGKGGKQARTQVEEELEEESESESGEEAEVAPKASKQNKGHPTAKAKGTAANEWALKAQRVLETKDYGDSWSTLVQLWWSREEEAGFVGGKQSWPAKKRPQAVSDWVGRARNYTPDVKDASAFGKEFWGPSDWVCMEYKGQNGFLNVLMLLKWWRDAMKDASPDWEEAMDDVTWVLQKMTANTSKKTPSPTPPAHAAGAVPMAQIAGNANRGEIPVAMQGTHGTAVVDTRIVPGTTPQLLSGGTSQGEQRREPNMAISHRD